MDNLFSVFCYVHFLFDFNIDKKGRGVEKRRKRSKSKKILKKHKKFFKRVWTKTVLYDKLWENLFIGEKSGERTERIRAAEKRNFEVCRLKSGSSFWDFPT